MAKVEWSKFPATCKFMSSIKEAAVFDSFYEGPFRNFDQHVQVKVLEALRNKKRFCIHFNSGVKCKKGSSCDYTHQCIICTSDKHGCEEVNEDGHWVCSTFTAIMNEHHMLSANFETLQAIHSAYAEHRPKKFIRPRFGETSSVAASAKSAWSKAPAAEPPTRDAVATVAQEELGLYVPLDASTRLKTSTSQLTLTGLPAGFTISVWKGDAPTAENAMISTHGLVTRSPGAPRETFTIRIEL